MADSMSYAKSLERASRLVPIVAQPKVAKLDKGKGIAQAQPKKASQKAQLPLQSFPPLCQTQGITIREPSSEGPEPSEQRDTPRGKKWKNPREHIQKLVDQPLDLRPENKQAKPKRRKTSKTGFLTGEQTQLLNELWTCVCNSNKDPRPFQTLEKMFKDLNGSLLKLTSDAGITGSYSMEPKVYHSQINLESYSEELPVDTRLFEQQIVPTFFLEKRKWEALFLAVQTQTLSEILKILKISNKEAEKIVHHFSWSIWKDVRLLRITGVIPDQPVCSFIRSRTDRGMGSQ